MATDGDDPDTQVGGRSPRSDAFDYEWLHAVLSSVSEAVMGCDAIGRVVFVGGAAAELFGYDPDAVLGRHFSAFVDPGELPEIVESIARWRGRSGRPVGHEVGLRCADGIYRRFAYSTRMGDGLFGEGSFLVTFTPAGPAEASGVPFPPLVENEERIARIASAFIDAGRDDFADALETAVAELSGLSVVTRITVWTTRNGHLSLTARWDAPHDAPRVPPPSELFIDVSPMLRSLLAGSEVRLSVRYDTDPMFAIEREAFAAAGTMSVLAVPLRAGGLVMGFVLLESTLKNLDFTATHVASVRSASAIIAAAMLRGAAEEELAERTWVDPTTGLANRWAARVDLQTLIDGLGGKTASEGGIGVVEIDLERFRLVNEALGHQAGDELLGEVASRLGRAAPERTQLARLSADEFLVVIPGLADETASLARAEELMEVFSVPFRIGDSATSMRARAGVLYLAAGEATNPTAGEVLRRIDNIVDRAKRSGVTIAVADADDDAQLRRLRRIGEIEQALGGGQLVPYYQAEWDLTSGRVVGAEALLRWQHPGEGLLAADEVIPLAESAGLIEPIGRHVLAEACSTARAWLTLVDGFVLRVNVSARQLRSEDFASEISDVLVETGFPASALCLELTESTLLDEPSASRRQFSRLRELGVGLAIDDFGTGYSSILALKQLPLSSLKIDQRFVAGVADSPSDRAIVEATLELARAFGVTATAEGVETEAQRAALERLGCERSQGFLFSGAESAAAFTARLESQAGSEPDR